ncbi:hypothetical protein R8Z50_14165 [Longispora sp. K20-0274]|uniref:hypothetical protein n=1 Tax=Longispora sp. K20-0274 TaxID=3088255 RepID=UPI00399A78AC
MSFVQIVTFSTDRVDEYRRLEAEWWAATEGRRTLLRDELYADRDAPGRYVAINEFASYESAMVNSALPETDEAARRAAELATGPVTFTNLDRVEGRHRPTLADLTFMHELFDVTGLVERLIGYLEHGGSPADLFADDVALDLNVPAGRRRLSGVGDVTAALTGERRRVTERHWTPTPDGFVLEWAWRTAVAGDAGPGPGGDQGARPGGDQGARPGGDQGARPGGDARGMLLARVRDGRIDRLTVHGAGDRGAV